MNMKYLIMKFINHEYILSVLMLSLKIGEWRPKGNTTHDRLVLIPFNDTLEKDTRGIFPDIVKVVFVMVRIEKG